MNLDHVTQPTLLLDPQRCKANIHRVIQKAKSQNVILRPHFKTHQSRVIGDWFREEGIEDITVSSLGMAHFFSTYGWKDITVAFPVNVRQMEEIKALSAKVKLGVLVVDAHTLDALGAHLKDEINIWIKIDVGTHRTGIHHEDRNTIDQILERFKAFPQFQFSGFLSHAGHSYQGRSVTEVQRIYDQTLDILLGLKKIYLGLYPDLRISLGDTPGVSMVNQLGPVDELRPGNFVFYDLMQEEIGACTLDDIAVAMACPVVAVHPERLQWIIYGGGIHFSKDYLPLEGGRKCFGRMVDIDDISWSVKNTKENPYLLSLSQEHGIVQCNEHNFNLSKSGDLTLWLPVHSCMTADAMGGYMTTDGDPVDHYREHFFK